MPLPFVLLLAVPLIYLVTALVPTSLVRGNLRRLWSAALVGASVPPVLAIVSTMQLISSGAAVDGPGIPGLSTRLDATTVVMLLLITTIAGVILRFSRRYLDGEEGQVRFLRWFLLTMTAASLLVVTNNLAVLGLAWLGSSLALHQLLTFYQDRPQALIAAHKKFLLGRLADVAIFGAIALIWRAMGTLEIDAILTQAVALPALPASMQLAGVLLAAGVVIRAAQLPFHGWLIQVMEAPTPVSALLHAGIVNIGGFVLIRLGALMIQLEMAQTLLVIAGTLTAVLAALVMTTRVSIKVALAWSTCAQMGFMLLECGLGAYSLALLHLLAHSLYKAHAFLSSGRAVEQQLLRSMTPAPVRETPFHWAMAAAGSVALVIGIGFVFGISVEREPTVAALGFILALALAPLLLRAGTSGTTQALLLIGTAVGLGVLYAGWHALFNAVMPTAALPSLAELLRIGFVMAAFLGLYVVQAVIRARPAGNLARALYPACFAGFYLDEIMTRLTFQLWPPRAAAAAVAAPRITAPFAVERVA